MTWLMESPIAIIGIAVLAEFALAAALFHTGQVRILAGMFLVAVVGLGLLFASRLVVTDREAVRATLDGAAHALMTNDPGKTLAYVAPDAKPLRDRIQALLPRVHFKEASIGAADIELHLDQAPPTATAKFMARARVQEIAGAGIGHEEVMARVVAELRKVGGRWLISDAQTADRRF